MAPGQKWRLLVGDAGGYVTARRAGDGDVGARDPRSGLPTLSTHHTFPPSRPRSSRMRCATPVGSYPRLCRPRHPIGCPRSTSWKQPSNQQARACDSRPAHLQPAGAFATLGGKASPNQYHLLDAWSVRAWPSTQLVGRGGRPFLPALAGISDGCQSECLVAFDKGLVLAQAVGRSTMALHNHTTGWIVVPQSGSVTTCGAAPWASLHFLLSWVSTAEFSLSDIQSLRFCDLGRQISDMEGRLPWTDRNRGRSGGCRALIWFPSLAPHFLVCRPRRHETCRGLLNGKYSRPSAGVASAAAPGSSCAVQMLHGQETII